MSKERDALKLALEALESLRGFHICSGISCDGVITAIREALAEQPAQRCSLCNYQHGHAIGCKNNPVDIALAKMAEQPAQQHDQTEIAFEAWWQAHGQFHRSGGGDYEKTFAWHAWLASLACTEQPAPATELLEQQEGPVAWMYDWTAYGHEGETVIRDWISANYDEAHSPTNGCHNIRPLYTSPPPRPSRSDMKPLTEWHPIETAPKETEVFIGAFIYGVFKFGRSEMFYEQANEFAGETWSGWVWSIDDCDDSVAEMPTHWMPLPVPPIEAAHGIKGNK